MSLLSAGPRPACVAVAAALALLLPATSPVHAAADPVSSAWHLASDTFTPPAACPELARRQALYRVCDDQRALFNEALAKAQREGKLLLVTFGSTWCPTCKSFSGMLEGMAGEDHTRGFTRVEIAVSTIKDGRRMPIATGEQVLKRVLDATPGTKLRSVPFIAVIDPRDPSRVFARNLDDCETPAGGDIDAKRVSQILAEAHAHVRQGVAAPGEPGWLRRKLRRWFAI